jgi:hypothetical protein
MQNKSKIIMIHSDAADSSPFLANKLEELCVAERRE